MSPVDVPESNPGPWTRGYDLGVKMGSNEFLYRAGVLLVPDEIVQVLEGDDLERWSAFAAGVEAHVATASGPGPEVVHLPQDEIARFSAGLQSGLGRGRALAATKRTAYSRTIRIDARDLRRGDLFCGPAEAKPRTSIPSPLSPGYEITSVDTPPGHGDIRFELNREGPGRVILVDPATRVIVVETGLTDEQSAMTEANLGLISFVIDRNKHLVTELYDYGDAWQDGYFGLARAVQLFDPTRGFTFSTYATDRIRQAIQKGRGRFESKAWRARVVEQAGHQAPPGRRPRGDLMGGRPGAGFPGGPPGPPPPPVKSTAFPPPPPRRMEAGVTHRPCPQGPIFDRRPRPSAEDRARRDAEQIVEALAENRDRPPFLHGLRRRLYPEQLWWRYLTRRCLG